MSYLDVPRMHFTGTFIANPSTRNNWPPNFDPSNYDNQRDLWNVNGNNFWQFRNCTVGSAYDNQGRVAQDPVLQAQVASTDSPVPAKLVDLDTQQQGVSQIWGLQIKVAVSDTDYFVGDFRVNCFNDLFSRVIGGRGMSAFSAYFQSVLDNVVWGSAVSSPFLQKLQSVSPSQLSIKFNVDGFQPVSTRPDFTQGRVVGTIGPAFADEPPNFVPGRALRSGASAQTNPFYGYARVDPIRQKLLVDLGNSIPTTSPGGPPPSASDFGTLNVVVGPSGNSPVNLGEYDYTQYETNAGIQEYSLTADQLAALDNTPLGIVQVTGQGGGATFLQEGQNGTYVCATPQFARMNPGDVSVVELLALQYGKPAAGQQLSVGFNSSNVLGPTPPPVGTSPGLAIPSSVTTDDDGRASFTMTATDPGNPREFIDGQVYGVAYTWAEDNDPNFPPDPNNFISVLVFDSFEKDPTWENVHPILKQFAVLYPYMDKIFQLDDPAVIQQNIAIFQQVLNVPMSDPRHMPVTRDMSCDKRQLILDWLALGAPVPGPATEESKARPQPPDTQKAPRPATQL